MPLLGGRQGLDLLVICSKQLDGVTSFSFLPSFSRCRHLETRHGVTLPLPPGWQSSVCCARAALPTHRARSAVVWIQGGALFHSSCAGLPALLAEGQCQSFQRGCDLATFDACSFLGPALCSMNWVFWSPGESEQWVSRPEEQRNAAKEM